MKKIIAVLVAAFIACTSAAVYAEGSDIAEIFDFDDLFSDDEYALLEKEINTISEEYGIDVVLITTNSLDGFNYGDDYVDSWKEKNCNENVLIFMIYNARDSFSRTYTSLGYGSCYEAVGNYFFDCISQKTNIQKKLSNGEFYAACREYYALASRFLKAAENGHPYSRKHSYFPMSYAVKGAFIAFAVILLGVFVYMEILRSKMKTVRSAVSAREYVKSGSFRLNNENDIFLYSNTVRTKIENDSDNHSSHTSGSSSGGGGGTNRF